MTEDTKRCTRCGETLPLGCFHARASKCKPCACDASREWYAANKARAAEGNRLRYLANADEIKARVKAWRLENRDRVTAHDRVRKKAEPERWSAYGRQYREANRVRLAAYDKARKAAEAERWAEYGRQRYQADRERRLAVMKQWRLANPETAAALSRRKKAIKRAATIVPFTPAQLDQRMSMFGRRCWMCGGAFEHVDHVKPLSRGGLHCLSNLRPACSACNTRKGARWPWPAASHRPAPWRSHQPASRT